MSVTAVRVASNGTRARLRRIDGERRAEDAEDGAKTMRGVRTLVRGVPAV